MHLAQLLAVPDQPVVTRCVASICHCEVLRCLQEP